MRKNISIDDESYDLLEEKKAYLAEQGFTNPTFSDAVKLACGRIKIQTEE